MTPEAFPILTPEELTKSQNKRLDYIMAEGYNVTVRRIIGQKVSFVVKKDHGSVYNDEGYHLFIGRNGGMTGVSSSNFGTAMDKEYERVAISLFFSKVFGRTDAGKVKFI